MNYILKYNKITKLVVMFKLQYSTNYKASKHRGRLGVGCIEYVINF